MTVLNVREGYRLWAATYANENAISSLENGLAAAMTPSLGGLRLLDAGCGVGRRLHEAGAASALGVDLSPEMLAEGAARYPSIDTMAADIRQLPLPDGGFDVIWCRLVLGHLPDCAPVYHELARVAAAGARLVVTDFHPDAHAAGHRRTFRRAGAVHELEHYVHDVAAHLNAAEAAGWRLSARRSAAIGPAARPFYEQAGCAALYPTHQGLNVVLGLAFMREA
ncbi:class I SAM-dependent methyltransferase [Gluconacetobacter tumulicola]|uniref:Methyltransferase domain-containing protein n=1 Tax=Gluconacetobacter tumulicola TaxID=1017177 RepID=A0A7W4JCV2_9PROT|nr:class I SAM-dependent methyltransferase [Gluconacetobacter tumulicola]MBB2178929.1 methyltransferase domain-containing protein [Gluconacetobacter tumulicola]